MSTISGLGKFLHGFSESEAKTEKATERGWYPFVTVSRQAGAGGLALAETLIGRIQTEKKDPLFVGWQSLDRELCRQVAEDPRLRVSLNNLLEERYRNAMEDFLHQAIARESPQIAVHKEVFRVIQRVAAVGKCVILGRGGNFLTRHYPRGIHIRLVAEREDRVLRFARLLSLSDAEAEKKVDELDRDRARLVRDYFKADIDDPLHYDAVWNTSDAPIDFIAEALVAMIRMKAEMEVDEFQPA
jgi:cytidylate kinase